MSSAAPDNTEAATLVWSRLRAFVEANDPKPDIRRRLGLGRGGGRVKVLLLLTAGPKSLAELAIELGVTPPYVTTVVDQLEGLGLVERTLDATNRRRKIVALTGAGGDAVQLAEELTAAPPQALGALTATELRTLDELLTRLAPHEPD